MGVKPCQKLFLLVQGKHPYLFSILPYGDALRGIGHGAVPAERLYPEAAHDRHDCRHRGLRQAAPLVSAARQQPVRKSHDLLVRDIRELIVAELRQDVAAQDVLVFVDRKDFR